MNVLVIGIDVCELNYMPKRVHANEMFVTFDSRQGKESNMFHNYETEKITRKALDASTGLCAVVKVRGQGETQPPAQI